ncbi:8-amino-7-oxononanoate synthase [Ventosimonas gracilis]|uniref:8-amino-7-oxononanoate synthase n=1 Tax=Ventosimonas gracilis TaxID=1680762 RepID=A0A139SXQ8_9GAMM|nr:8-amino-7-oxononanoate synthase [Ventosimonas gracilis]KXU39386.1 8-amino-7-oxononanoate synthase [Ventosimonas gracilis]
MAFNLTERLNQRRVGQLLRQRLLLDSPQQPLLQVDGKALLSFCSNDYLGLANHPEVIAALQEGAKTWGTGGGASHLVSGHSRVHQELEEALADFCGRERALLFSSGYAANLAAICALVGRGDSVLQDRLNHASLIDGALLSGARFARYQHGDLTSLEQHLERISGDCLIVTDGVFSMDGDLAPLPQIAQIAQRKNAWLMVDDAHGFGVLGETGGGSVQHFALKPNDVPVLIGTLGKAFGTAGAFIAGSDELIECLIQFARPYIYSTASPPALAAATLKSLQLLQLERWRREHLGTLIARFRQGAADLGLPLLPSQTPIQPLLTGSSERALHLARLLRSRGILVPAIRPPTVPQGQARLRVTLSAAHNTMQLEQLLSALAECWGKLSD